MHFLPLSSEESLWFDHYNNTYFWGYSLTDRADILLVGVGLAVAVEPDHVEVGAGVGVVVEPAFALGRPHLLDISLQPENTNIQVEHYL